jgi:uracil-DNA glycosylase
MNDNFAFGYPRECSWCANVLANSGSQLTGLQVAPFLKNGTGLRVMLVGQDPTISRNPERVKQVLMLDQENGQLSRWLRGIFGPKNFTSIALYATNAVKCSFTNPPSSVPGGGRKFLEPYFRHCRQHLSSEVLGFRPKCVLTLGEPAHALFLSILDNANEMSLQMKEAFTGKFVRARLQGFEFDYSSCLHIRTFRVAEQYGTKVEQFKQDAPKRAAKDF